MRAPFPSPLLHGSLTVSTDDVLHHRVVLNFDETLEQVNQADPTSFGVMINGQVFAVTSIGVSDNAVGMADNQVFLYLENVTNARGETFDWITAGVSVTYTHTTGDLSTVIQDLAGNDATSFNDYLPDTLAPDALISISDTLLSSGDVAIMTVSFSEAVTNLDVSDFTVANGYLDNLATANGGKTWTADLKANTGVDDTSNIITLASTYTDLHGNAGTGYVSTNYTIDTRAPALTGTSRDSVAKTVTFTFDEALSNDFAASEMFIVTDGTTDPLDATAVLEYAVLSVGINGNMATISINTSIHSANPWTVTYADPVGNDTYALQDLYGTDVSSFSRVI
jgi:hypothetical protein